MTTSVSDLRQSQTQEAVFFPASFAQQRLWFLDQLTPGRATYNLPSALRIQGKLDADVLKRAVGEVARRHETLRTRFVAAGGELQQVIEDQINVQLRVVDLTFIAEEEERKAEAMRLAQEEAQEPFDLRQVPLFRGKLLRLGALNHVLLFTMHHIISDAWSIGVLIEEVSVLYDAFSAGQPSSLPELPIQYADYSVWQREWLEGGVLEQQLAYWKQQLGGSGMLMLPTDRPRPAVQSQNGAICNFVIAMDVTQKLKELAEEQGATLFIVLVAALQTLLYRYSGQPDIAVGTPIAGRRSSETERLIGFFINTLVLRVDLSGAPSFTELLQRTKEVTLEAFAHQDVPFEKLVEVLSPERSLGGTPLFQVMMVLQNAPQSDLRLGAATLQPFNTVDNGTSKFDLTMNLAEGMGQEGIRGSLEYNTGLFEAATVARMIGHYSRLLSSMTSTPHAPIHSLEILSPEERGILLEDFNATAASIPDKTVIRLFEDQVDRTPHAMAVRCGEESLSYLELDQRANQLAHYLKQMGVGPEILVGICLNRSLEMIVVLLGILKSGGAYVPLDSSYPVERLGFILEDAQISILLTQASLRGSLPMAMVRIISIDEDRKDISTNSVGRVEGCVLSSNLAYVIYTSGSTGQPKGVGVTHNGMVNYVNWASQTYKVSQGCGSPVYSSLAFDLTVTSIYPTLLTGGCLEVFSQLAGMEELAQRLEASDYSLLKLTPSHLRMLSVLLEKSEKGECGARALIIGGEALRYADLELWRKPGSRTRLINEYGPTETVVGSTVYEVEDERQLGDVPVGKPIVNTEIYILGPDMEPLPVGVPGELYIGGAGLARGYVNRPSLTAERFIPNPFKEPGARMYTTGDRARWRGDGNLEYLGRNDEQVKIRGYRIELGEIEATLERHPGVAQSVVLAREDHPGEKRLIAYVVKKTDVPWPNASGLEEYLKVSLPDYMVPMVFVELETLPLNHNGKIDRKNLPQPDTDTSEEEYVGPRNPTEETLCRLWQEVLRRERVGIYDNFFNIGGHSLLAAQVISRIKLAFAIEMPLSALFVAPTVARMAEHIAAVNEPERPQASPILVSIQPQGSRTPFFCVHPVGGQVICYAELSQELGLEQPFYGLQSPPANCFPGSVTSIEQMARLYNQEVMRVQPNGPYLLGGWSMGGLIAFEMARQLREEGQPVGLLALFDTHPSGQQGEGIDATQATDGYRDDVLLARFALDMARLLGKNFGELRERFLQLEWEEQFKLVQETLTREGVLSQAAARKEMTNLFEAFSRNTVAIDNYLLQSSEQPVVLFVAADSEEPDYLRKEWILRMGQGIELRRVPGDHYTMLKKPYVSLLAKLLEHFLAEAQGEDSFAQREIGHDHTIHSMDTP
jgi:amino acid adenylation domain-containing protein